MTRRRLITPNTCPPREVGDTWDGIAWRLLNSFGIEVTRDQVAQLAHRVLMLHSGEMGHPKASAYSNLLNELFGITVKGQDAFEFCDEVYLDITPPQSDELRQQFEGNK